MEEVSDFRTPAKVGRGGADSGTAGSLAKPAASRQCGQVPSGASAGIGRAQRGQLRSGVEEDAAEGVGMVSRGVGADGRTRPYP